MPEGLSVSFLPWWVMAVAVWVSLWVDARWGEPRAAWHPVVWMGRLLDACRDWVAPPDTQGGAKGDDRSDTDADWGAFVRGAGVWWLGAVVVVAVALGCAELSAWLVAWGLPTAWQAWGGAVLLGILLKPLLAWQMLHREVAAVDAALEVSLAAGRQRLAWLCSRDVENLGVEAVRETAIETLAENLNDSVVAPLFWFLVAGLPGAALYRWANTADAMWGYRGTRSGRVWTWAGKWAARADDVLSWLPARLTGLLIMLPTRLSSSRRWVQWWQQARLTPSPNGGWPMAAMALQLGVRLAKPGVYTLNAEGAPPGGDDVAAALLRAERVVAGVRAVALLSVLWGAWMTLQRTSP